jgi:ADP-ribosylglycohydrolase
MTTATRMPSPLLGCAIGDALGKPFENYLDPLSPDDIVWDGSSFLSGCPQPEDDRMSKETRSILSMPGVHTDDTQMTRLLADSLVQNRKWDRDSAITYYLSWFRGDSFVGAPRGMGGTIEQALRAATDRTSMGVALDPWKPCGTGTAMRAGVLGFLPEDWILAAREDALLTHRHPEAVAGSIAMAAAVNHVLHNDTLPVEIPRSVLRTLLTLQLGHTAVAYGVRTAILLAARDGQDLGFRVMPGNDVVGLVCQTLGIVAMATSYEQGVGMAVRMGGDTDTRAAMVGTILGTRFGLEGIPQAWVDAVYESRILQSEDGFLRRLARV